MSKIDFILKVFGVSTVIFSNYLTPTNAQTVQKLQSNQYAHTLTNIQASNSQNSLLTVNYQGSGSNLPKQEKKLSIVKDVPGLNPIQLSQAIPEPTETTPEPTETTPEPTETTSEVQTLEPDPNLLLRPTLPAEVEINLNEAITLEEAIALSLRNNKNLQQAKLQLERSRQELQQAEAALYPNLDLQVNLQNSESASADRSIARGASADLVDQNTSSVDGTVTLSYNLYTGGNRGADIARAKKTVEFNQLDLERITEQSLFETTRDYYNLQNADAQVEIEQAAVEDAQQTLKDAQLLEQAGLGTRFDVLRAEVELANAQQRLTTRQSEQETARRQLAATISLGEQVNLTTADEIKEAGNWNQSLEETIILAYGNRAELDQFLVRKEIDLKQREIALSAIRPQLSVFANYNLQDILDDDIDVGDGYTLGARLQWALFDGGAAKARAKQQETTVKIDENSFADQRNQVRLETEQAYFGLKANQTNIDTAQKAVELAEESLRLARLRFQAGVGTQTDVIDAQSQLTTARGNRLTAIIQYNQSLNQLLRAVNGLASENN